VLESDPDNRDPYSKLEKSATADGRPIRGPSVALEESLVLERYDGPHDYPEKKPY
jgi:hypothetical protein